jgi:HK97 family phage prohead protease
VLWSHDPTQVIGKAVSIGVVNGRMQSAMQFNPQSGIARSIEAAVRGGYIRASSVGFRPLDWTPRGDGSIDFKQIELLEYSIVGIPANPEALVIGMTDANGKAFGPKIRAKREREVELAKLRSVPFTEKEKRAVELAAIKAR